MAKGMEQGEARRRAKELGGIAVEARWSEAKQKWVTGGWASAAGKAWIVINTDYQVVLDDGTGAGIAPVERPEPGDQLTTLLEQGAPYEPAQLRKIAELTELLYTNEKARPWWERAAEAGDEDAIGYLELLREDEADPDKAKAETADLMKRLGIEE